MFSKTPGLVLGPTHLATQIVPDVLSGEVKVDC